MLNEIIEEYSNRDDIESITITDDNQQDLSVTDMIPLAQTRSESKSFPAGSLSTMGQEEASTTFFAPEYMKAVNASCYSSGAIITVQTVTTEALGVANVGTKLTNFGTITVSIAASNTNCKVKYRTMDSNGGRCSWKGIE